MTEPPHGAGDTLSEILRLQTEFQGRMVDETLRYLRRVQGMFEPHSPGTVLRPDAPDALAVTVPVGGRTSVQLDVENRQRVHTALAAVLTPLVGDDGTTWFVDADARPAFRLLAPAEQARVTVRLRVPADVPPGLYRGLVTLRGLHPAGVPLEVTVTEVVA
ncbi:hypothetical protein HP550_11665 [Cellulomonas humilata]|uniref:Uncharacterized protein n=1 Tax=Cellulomonas humilata TaxID=144055 RepID=A0A7Y6A185_9CELL|nr:hypothetical protein [Cellulomonas humilata]NUU17906.1 hypothetical protein [Cellulomonas humilata]